MDMCLSVLPEMKDLAKYERQIMDKKISPCHLICLYKNMKQISQFFSLCKKDKIINQYFMGKLGISSMDCIEQHAQCVIEFIEKHIDVDIAEKVDVRMNIGKAMNDFEVSFFLPNVSAKLDMITNLYNKTTNKLEAIRAYLCEKVKNDPKQKRAISTDPVILHETDKGGIFNLITTQRRTQILEALYPETGKIETLSYISGTKTKIFDFPVGKKVFQYSKQGASSDKYSISNSQINELCSQKTISKSEMKTTISDVYMEFLEQFGQLQSSVDSVIQFITTIDMIFSKTQLALKYGYCKPQFGIPIDTMDFTDQNNIKNKTKAFVQCGSLRHPLIEQLQTDTNYVPNDLQIGINSNANNSANKNYSGILLYGTNMAGKTSFIKSLGIAVIMAQAGLYVPASEFVYMPYQYIFTRILGNDNLFKGQSTFATEMIELRTILRLANTNSLVIGDELCSGTETASAVGIFMAGIKRLYEIDCSFIFATHLHEIVEFEEFSLMSAVRFCHMKVHYNREKDELIYDRKICEGSGETMYGLEVCKYLKLPTDFIESSYAYRKKFIENSECFRQEPDILLLKPSRYNSQKLKGIVCENCGLKISTEIHHIVEQHTANQNGLVISKKEKVPIHKNKKANLKALCESCHLKEHHSI